MTKKYEPTHAWVKELGLKGMFAEAADTAANHAGTIISNTNPPDLMFMAVWLALAYELKKMGITKYIMGSADWWRRLIGGDTSLLSDWAAEQLKARNERVKNAENEAAAVMEWLGVPGIVDTTVKNPDLTGERWL